MKKQANKKSKSRRTTPAVKARTKKNIPVASSEITMFPVVGIGGSAGGLEAFEQFFKIMPPDSGMAFVIVAHLDPSREGSMPELIQRDTAMKVLQAQDNMKILRNTVYIIPSNKDIAMLNGKFQLFDPMKTDGLHLPIDYFFRSLAEDRGSWAAGILFSGMGSDGTKGILAIKKNLGMVIVQDPETAKYDGMPTSAISTGIVDAVLAIKDMPIKLMRFAKNLLLSAQWKATTTYDATTNAIQKILLLVRHHTGHDLSAYKKTTLNRRIERRMEVNDIRNISDYVLFLQTNRSEIDILFKELLIGVTKFFRDAEGFESLRAALAPVLKTKTLDSPVRIWVPGCSTGEEAYSIAILIKEYFDKLNRIGLIQIYATDIKRESIDKARTACYPAAIRGDVSQDRLNKYFIFKDNKYCVKREIRDMVIFAEHDVHKDPPFMRLDLLSCRNLLIYMNAKLQQRVISLFHYSLNPGGILFLGTAESTGELAEYFTPFDARFKIFKRSKSAIASNSLLRHFDTDLASTVLPESGRSKQPTTQTNESMVETTNRLLLKSFTPPSVVVDAKGNVLLITGKTGKYLELPVGQPTMSIFEMVHEAIRPELYGAIHSAGTDNKKVMMHDLPIKVTGGYRSIDLIVEPLQPHGHPRGSLLVVFQEKSFLKETDTHKIKMLPPGKEHLLLVQLEKELKSTKDQLLKTRTAMEQTTEEHKSAYEELQSINEEHQSTNEELTTSKEEMQSLNEELVTINSEYQEKIGELTLTSNDMKNLLDSTAIATLFLDNNLCIKRFTPSVAQIMSLIPTDIGRPITDIAMNLRYDGIIKNSREVLANLVRFETQVQTNDNHWYIMRILPYRTIDNRIDGVVFTFTDISLEKELEGKLLAARLYAEGIVDTVREALIVLDTNLNILSANHAFYTLFRTTPARVISKFLYHIEGGRWDIQQLRAILHEVLDKNKNFKDYIVEDDFRSLGHKKLILNARRVMSEDKKTDMILLAFDEVTEVKGGHV